MKKDPTIREKLVARYAEVQGRLARITNDVRHTSKPLDPDFAEQAVELENEEVLVALDDSIRAEMAQIERTLAQLDRGEYGICESCGGKIAPKRLAALPHATRCVACEEKTKC
ncbi:MAG: TraR/DksA family transcriptional regulator [Acidobacteriota bacterium]